MHDGLYEQDIIWEGPGTCCCCACYNTSKGTVNAYRRWCKCWAGLSFFPLFFTRKLSKPCPSLCYPCAELHTRELTGCISSSQLSCLDSQAAKLKTVNTMKDSYVYTELICKCVYLNKEQQFAVHCVCIHVDGRLIQININLVLPCTSLWNDDIEELKMVCLMSELYFLKNASLSNVKLGLHFYMLFTYIF